MARLIAFICVALLALQATSALPDVKSLLEAEAQKVRGLVQGAITKAEETVDTIKDKIETAVENEVAKVQSSVKGFAQKVIDKVEAAKQKAEAEGKAVAECLIAVPQDIHNVAESIINDAVSCITGPVKEGRAIIADLVSLAQQANQTLYDVQTQVAACDQKAGALESSLCKLNALGAVAVDITKITTAISGDVARAIQLVSTLQSSFSTCEVSVWTNAPIQAASIITTVTQCLKDAVSQ